MNQLKVLNQYVDHMLHEYTDENKSTSVAGALSSPSPNKHPNVNCSTISNYSINCTENRTNVMGTALLGSKLLYK